MRIEMTKEIELDNFRDIIINQFYVNINSRGPGRQGLLKGTLFQTCLIKIPASD